MSARVFLASVVASCGAELGSAASISPRRDLTEAQRRLGITTPTAPATTTKASSSKIILKRSPLRLPERRLSDHVGRRTGEVFTTETLQTAVSEWCDDPAAAAITYGDISTWDTSHVTSLRGLFMPTEWEGHCSSARTFDADISSWDVSSVTNMEETFSGSWAFHQDLSRWDVSNVVDFRFCFDHALDFDADISKWDVSKAQLLDGMFSGATHFNADISGWNVRNVDRFKYTFEYTSQFNQDLSPWAVSNAYDFSSMFEYATSFSQTLCWNIPENAITTKMFDGSAGGSLSSSCPTPQPTRDDHTHPSTSPAPSPATPEPTTAANNNAGGEQTTPGGSEIATNAPTSHPTLKPTAAAAAAAQEEESQHGDDATVVTVFMTMTVDKELTDDEALKLRAIMAFAMGVGEQEIQTFSVVALNDAGEAVASFTARRLRRNRRRALLEEEGGGEAAGGGLAGADFGEAHVLTWAVKLTVLWYAGIQSSQAMAEGMAAALEDEAFTAALKTGLGENVEVQGVTATDSDVSGSGEEEEEEEEEEGNGSPPGEVDSASSNAILGVSVFMLVALVVAAAAFHYLKPKEKKAAGKDDEDADDTPMNPMAWNMPSNDVETSTDQGISLRPRAPSWE